MRHEPHSFGHLVRANRPHKFSVDGKAPAGIDNLDAPRRARKSSRRLLVSEIFASPCRMSILTSPAVPRTSISPFPLSMVTGAGQVRHDDVAPSRCESSTARHFSASVTSMSTARTRETYRVPDHSGRPHFKAVAVMHNLSGNLTRYFLAEFHSSSSL